MAHGTNIMHDRCCYDYDDFSHGRQEYWRLRDRHPPCLLLPRGRGSRRRTPTSVL